MTKQLLSAVFLIIFIMVDAFCFESSSSINDPALEERAREIFVKVLCPVCQGQSIADSQTAMAHKMRNEIITLIKSGESDIAIEDFIIKQYGTDVLLRPRFGANTILLWALPLLGLLALFVMVIKRIHFSERHNSATINSKQKNSH